MRSVWKSESGLTLVELLVAIVMLAILVGLGFQGLLAFTRSAVPDRAATAIAGDVALTRNYAIQRGVDVALVADEANRTYEIRTSPGGEVLQARSFSASTDLPLTVLDVATAGDALTFNSRGMLDGGLSSVTIDVGRFGDRKRIRVTALGRVDVTTP